jgi:hypothetical protein
MPPTAQQRSMEITSTDSFEISHPDDLNSKLYNGETNRALLEKLMPEMKEKIKGNALTYTLYP